MVKSKYWFLCLLLCGCSFMGKLFNYYTFVKEFPIKDTKEKQVFHLDSIPSDLQRDTYSVDVCLYDSTMFREPYSDQLLEHGVLILYTIYVGNVKIDSFVSSLLSSAGCWGFSQFMFRNDEEPIIDLKNKSIDIEFQILEDAKGFFRVADKPFLRITAGEKINPQI